MRRCLLLLLALAPLVAKAQDRDKDEDAIIVTAPIHIDKHPSAILQKKYFLGTSQEDALDCHPQNHRAACGKAIWNADQLPLDVKYTTRIPATVQLDGPTEDVIFTPFVRCIVTDKDGRRFNVDAPGVECRTVLKEDGDYLRWAFGGQIYPEDGLEPGSYSGLIPVAVSDQDSRWEYTMPVELNIERGRPTCFVRPEKAAILDFDEVDLVTTPKSSRTSQTFASISRRSLFTIEYSPDGGTNNSQLIPEDSDIVYTGVSVVDQGNIPGLTASLQDDNLIISRSPISQADIGKFVSFDNEKNPAKGTIEITATCYPPPPDCPRCE